MEKLKRLSVSDFKTIRKVKYLNKKEHEFVTVEIDHKLHNYDHLLKWIKNYNSVVDFFNDDELRKIISKEKFRPSFEIIGPSLSAEKYVKDMTADEFQFALDKYNQRYKNGNKNYFKLSLNISQKDFLKRYPGNKHAINDWMVRWYINSLKIYEEYSENPTSNQNVITQEQFLAIKKIVDFCEKNGIQQTRRSCYTKEHAYALIDYYEKYRKNKNVKSPFPCVYDKSMKSYDYRGKSYNIGLFLRSLRLSYANELGVSAHNNATSGYLTNWSNYKELVQILEINGVDWKTRRIINGENLELKR